jgi:transmembrane 9 superfamily protein 2/4
VLIIFVIFSVFVGTGAQLSCMCIATLSFAMIGLLSPANRGSLVTVFILLFVFMGSFAGYYSSTIYKMFRGTLWKQNTLLTAFLYPGVVFCVIFVLNLVLWFEGSSGAIPFPSFFTLLFLWFCVSVPLVFLGSFFGYKRETAAFPVRTNQIPRAIPQQPWYMSPVIACVLGGILPFGAVSVELFFIMSALWLHHIYYIFGFLFLVMIVLTVTCAEVSILLCYFQLCNEDYRWWWRSFLASGSCAAYILLYAVWYNMTELELSGGIPLLLYFGYMSIIAFTFFLITGTIGYFSAFWFNTCIYGSIKVD